MRSLISIVFALLLVVVLVYSCTTSTNESDCSIPLNPNGDSELALLMREMSKHLETERAFLLNQQLPGEFPISFEKIRSAVPSDPKSISVNYDAFALMYLAALKQYHQSDSLKLAISNFNNLVHSCVNCHKNECPGPVKKIEKSYIK